MEKVRHTVQRIFAFGAGLSLALVFAIILVNSVRRYTIGKSFPWGEELPVYLAVYGVMFGIALAYMTDSHIRFSVLTDLLSENTSKRLFVLSDVATAILGLFLSIAGHAFATRRGGIDSPGLKSSGDWLTQTTGIEALEWFGKVGTWQYAVVIGGVLLCIAAVLRLSARISNEEPA